MYLVISLAVKVQQHLCVSGEVVAVHCAFTEPRTTCLHHITLQKRTDAIVSSFFFFFFCLSSLHLPKPSLRHQEMMSYRQKRRLFLFNCCFCLLAVYFYRRHNKYCEAGSECNISTVLSFTPPMFLSAIVPFWGTHKFLPMIIHFFCLTS